VRALGVLIVLALFLVVLPMFGGIGTYELLLMLVLLALAVFAPLSRRRPSAR